MTVKEYQEDPYKNYLKKIAKVESNNNPLAKSKTSSATGLYQFLDSTWRNIVEKHNLGYSLEDRKNPEKAEKVMRYFVEENERVIKPVLGRELNDADRYLTHFLGAGGASKFFTEYNKNPNAPITLAMSQHAINANRSVALNKNGTVKSLADVYGWAGKKMSVTPPDTNHISKQTTEQDYTPYDTNFAITKIDEGVTPQQQAKQELKDINNEKQLIEDLVNSTFEIPQEKKEQQNYQQPQVEIQEPTLIESYAQIANFIDTPMVQQGGFVVTRSNDRKGKTHKVTASDGTVKYFGDSNLGQHPKDPERKAAFYARHKENLKNNPFFRAFARKTWQEGGEINYEDTFQQGGLQNYFNVIEDQQGQRKFPNQITKINGDTIATDGYGNIPLYVVPNVGKPRIIFPNTGEHTFKGATNFTEYPVKNQEIPIAQESIEVKQQVNGAKNITFNQAFKEARVALGANQIFEYNGKKYGTNLKGETFNPSEEVLKNNNLPIQETKERLQKQNTLVDNPYSTKTTVKIEPYYKNWAEIEKEKISFNKMEDADKIIKYKQGDNGSFAIVDKKKGLINIYNSGENKPIFTSAIDLGASKSDAQTTTKYQDTNKDGKITDEDKINGKFKVDWSAGNTSTGAGKFYISNIDSKGYEGLPILNMMNEGQYKKFKKTGEIEQVSTSFHKGYIKDDNNRVSNGCIRCNKTTLDNLTKYLKNTSEVYILPEDKNNRFELKDGKLSFKVNASTNYNAYIDSKGIVQKGQGVNKSTNTLQYKPIQISLDEEKFKDKVFQWNDFNDEAEFKNTTKPFIKSLQDSKQKVMKAAKIDGDTYNNIAKVAFGIYGTESNFGDTHSGVGNLLRAVNKVTDSSSSSSPDVRSKATTYGATDNNNSVGYTQIRWSQLNDREKEVLKNLEITSNKDLLNPKKSATATVAILAVRYQEQLTAKQKEDIFNYLPKKWNNRENYSSRVNKNLEYLTIKELVK